MWKNLIILSQFFVICLILAIGSIAWIGSEAFQAFGQAIGFVDKVYTNTHDGMKRIQERNEKFRKERDEALKSYVKKVEEEKKLDGL